MTAAHAEGISLDVVDIRPRYLQSDIDALGDIVLYRSASFPRSEEPAVFKCIGKRRTLINSVLMRLPEIRSKAGQQTLVKELGTVQTIPTHHFSQLSELHTALDSHTLRFPIIQKPLDGRRGENIHLHQTPHSISHIQNIGDFVFQPYIFNTGDFRIIVVNRRVVGMMKRRAPEGEFLNNVSRGGITSTITDPTETETLAYIAKEVIRAIPLHVAGIDIIQDTQTGKYHFLEINAAPQWRAFEKLTKIDVAKEIIQAAVQIHTTSVTTTA